MEECLGERINVKRTEDALAVNPESIVTACPYCLTMMEDGVKLKNMNEQVRTVDLAELVVEAIG
jgi:Fe-S oxidoreductase